MSANKFHQAFINSVSSEQADEILTKSISNEVAVKLAVNRSKGKEGWHTTDCSTDSLKKQLRACVAKNDYVDAMILAGMIHVRESMAG